MRSFIQAITIFLTFTFTACGAGFGSSQVHAAAKPRRLSLQQALALMLKRNPMLARERLSIQQAKAGVGVAQGAFRFDLNLSLRLDRSLLPAGLQVSPSLLDQNTSGLSTEQLRLHGSVELSRTFQTGTKVALSFINGWSHQDRLLVSRIIDGIDNPLAGTQQGSTSLNLQVTQPLLKGAWLKVNQAPIKAAKERVKMAKHQTSWFVVQQVAQAALRYWDLVYAQKQLEIAQNALILAKRQRKDTLSLIKAGKLPGLERYQVEQVVAARSSDIIKAKRSVDQAQTALAALLHLPRSTKLVTTDSPQGMKASPALKSLLAWAQSNHPQMKVANSQLSIARLSRQVSRNQLLPQLDLVGGFSLVGFGRHDVQSQQGSSLGGAYGSLLDPRSHSFYVGLQLKIPLGNETAKSRDVQNALEVQRSKLAMASLEREIQLNIRRLYRDIQRTTKQLKAAKTSLQWAKKKYDAEQSKYKAGKSTLFQVLQYQHDLAAAQLSLLRAQIDQRRSQIALYAQVGSLPGTYGIRKAS